MKFMMMFDSEDPNEPPKPWWYRLVAVCVIFGIAIVVATLSGFFDNLWQ